MDRGGRGYQPYIIIDLARNLSELCEMEKEDRASNWPVFLSHRISDWTANKNQNKYYPSLRLSSPFGPHLCIPDQHRATINLSNTRSVRQARHGVESITRPHFPSQEQGLDLPSPAYQLFQPPMPSASPLRSTGTHRIGALLHE